MRAALSLTLLASLSACAGQKFVGSESVKQLETLDALPTPGSTQAFDVRVPYRIGAYDKLRYVFVGFEPPEGEAVVDTSGSISVPIAGQIKVGGLTPAEAEAAIAEALRRNHVRTPMISINAVEINSQTVTVEGAVRDPGLYPAGNGTTLLRALASAKGLTEYARTNQVAVFRTIDGKNYAALYSLKAIRAGVYPDPQLNPGDVVSVDESRISRYFRDALSASGALLSPVVILLTQ